VNVFASREWQRVVAVLLRALDPHPDAQALVIDALRAALGQPTALPNLPALALVPMADIPTE